MLLRVNIQATFLRHGLSGGCVRRRWHLVPLTVLPQQLESVTRKDRFFRLASANKYNDLIPELAGTVSAEVEVAEVLVEVQKPVE